MKPTASLPSKTPRLPALLLAFVASLPLSSLVSRAEWTGGSGSKNYDDTANWAGGVIDGVFSGTLGGALTATINSTPYALSQGLQFTYTDNFKTVLLANTPGGTWNLGGDLLVDVAGTGSQTVELGAASRAFTLDLGGATRAFAINPGAVGGNAAGLDTLNVYGTITDGSVLKTGAGTLQLATNGRIDTTGDLLIKRGIVDVGTVGAITNAGSLVLQGGNSLFRMYALSTQNVNGAMPVALGGGLFVVANGTGSSTSLGAVTLTGGRSVIAVGNTTGTLTLDSLTRDNQALLNLSGLFTPGVNTIKVTNDANLLSGLIGGGGAAGSTNVSILPWIFGSGDLGTATGNVKDTGSWGSWGGFVTYDHATGFRLLTPGEYSKDDLAGAGATDNVQLTAETDLTGVHGARTINSLWITNGTYTLAGDAVLTITSGALLSSGVTTGANPQNTLTGGTIQAGAGQALIINGGRVMATIASRISGDSGIIAAQDTTLSNTGNNYAGATIAAKGTLYTGASEVLPDGTDVRVDETAFLNLGTRGSKSALTETIRSLTGSGTVDFSSASSRLNIGATSGGGSAGYITVGAGGSVSPGDPSGDFRANALYINQAVGVQVDSAPLTNVAGIVFEAGSALHLDLAGATSYDSLQLFGAAGATINGGTLYITLLDGYVPEAGQTFTSIVGTAAASGPGFDAIVDTSGSGLSWTFTADGNNWVLTASSAIPEPAACALIGGALALLGAGLLRRGRRRRA